MTDSELAIKEQTNKVKYYASRLPKPRWWEFWKREAYRQECERVKEEFIKDFSQPTPIIPGQMDYLRKAVEIIDEPKVWFSRTDNED